MNSVEAKLSARQDGGMRGDHGTMGGGMMGGSGMMRGAPNDQWRSRTP